MDDETYRSEFLAIQAKRLEREDRQRKARELVERNKKNVDDMWDALPLALIGSLPLGIGLITALVSMVFDPCIERVIAGVLIAFSSIFLFAPWHEAHERVVITTKELKKINDAQSEALRQQK